MHRIGFVVPQRFQLLSVAALTAFEVANMSSSGPYYDIELLSEHGGPVPTSGGMKVDTLRFGDHAYDTIMVGSLTDFEIPAASAAMIAFLRQAATVSRRVASICSGAFTLAEAGLLDGRRATMHWAHAASFRSRFPKVKTEEDRIFINDGPVWTSAGMTAGVDLALALVETDLGASAAKTAARFLVMNERRLGGQKQHSELLEMTPKSDRIALVITHVRENLRSALTVEELANVASLSPRQFSRAFLDETGQSPAKAVEQIRVEAASFMIEDGRHSINEIAREAGFADRERMRRAFMRTLGRSPQTLRREARDDPGADA